jgi:hypothetical protein
MKSYKKIYNMWELGIKMEKLWGQRNSVPYIRDRCSEHTQHEDWIVRRSSL